jgi:hypothetical protein
VRSHTLRPRCALLHLPIAALSALLVLACSGHSGPGGPGGLPPALAFDELDADADGAIDAEEFRRLTDAMFRRIDRDGDGRLSREEYERLAERRRHRRQGPRPGVPDGGFPGGGPY